MVGTVGDHPRKYSGAGGVGSTPTIGGYLKDRSLQPSRLGTDSAWRGATSLELMRPGAGRITLRIDEIIHPLVSPLERAEWWR